MYHGCFCIYDGDLTIVQLNADIVKQYMYSALIDTDNFILAKLTTMKLALEIVDSLDICDAEIILHTDYSGIMRILCKNDFQLSQSPYYETW
jgi:hypothetical protein